jgi:hypothetical protein
VDNVHKVGIEGNLRLPFNNFVYAFVAVLAQGFGKFFLVVFRNFRDGFGKRFLGSLRRFAGLCGLCGLAGRLRIIAANGRVKLVCFGDFVGVLVKIALYLGLYGAFVLYLVASLKLRAIGGVGERKSNLFFGLLRVHDLQRCRIAQERKRAKQLQFVVDLVDNGQDFGKLKILEPRKSVVSRLGKALFCNLQTGRVQFFVDIHIVQPLPFWALLSEIYFNILDNARKIILTFRK